jgi:hypothetical protein
MNRDYVPGRDHPADTPETIPADSRWAGGLSRGYSKPSAPAAPQAFVAAPQPQWSTIDWANERMRQAASPLGLVRK